MRKISFFAIIFIILCNTQLALGAVGGPRKPYVNNPATGDSFYTGEGWRRDRYTDKLRATVPSLIGLERVLLGNKKEGEVRVYSSEADIQKLSSTSSENTHIPIESPPNMRIEIDVEASLINCIDLVTGITYSIPYEWNSPGGVTLGEAMQNSQNQRAVANETIKALNKGSTPKSVVIEFFKKFIIRITRLPRDIGQFLAFRYE